jgi:hypothetical protein
VLGHPDVDLLLRTIELGPGLQNAQHILEGLAAGRLTVLPEITTNEPAPEAFGLDGVGLAVAANCDSGVGVSGGRVE